jgi:hypothetical protein
MTSRSRRIRRLGALALLLAWAPVATANAVACGAWCELNGGANSHHATSVHAGHDHGGAPQATHGSTIADPNCAGPDLLIVSAIAPDLLSVPSVTVTADDPPVASPISLIVSSPGIQTPPPRA